jgi:hypothetical protein
MESEVTSPNLLLLIRERIEMTDETIRTIAVALITSIPPTLVACASLYQSIKNGVKADTAAKEAARAVVRAEDVSTKADVIHEATLAIREQTDGINSRLSADNTALRSMVSSLEKQVVALATAITPREAVALPPEQVADLVTKHPELDRRKSK